MGTRSITFIRKRIPKEVSSAKSSLGGPDGQYIYEYFVCMYQQCDGYVRGGVGEWLAEFLCKFLHDYSSKYMDTGFLAAKFVKAYMEKDTYTQSKRLFPITSLEKMFRYDHQKAYIITTDSTRKFFDNKSIMLTSIGNCIITARPEKFMMKYLQCVERMEESRIPNEVIDYGDDEIEKEGYLAEDQLLSKFLTNLYSTNNYYY
jgi:hypothetical protein